MNIFVTGGAGFIGKYLVDSLLKNGNRVTIFDNFSNSDKKSLGDLINKGVKVIEGDITELESISNAMNNQEIIIHLAAKISVEDSIRNPLETFRVNVEGTKNVLLACEKNHIKKLIAASSAAVYGEGNQNSRLTEKSQINPISPYGESKKMMEDEIEKFGKNNKINYIILRFFNIYGIGQSPEYAGVISKFLDRIGKNEPLEIFGDGLQTRDFVHIQDVINSIHNAISHSDNEIFNISSGKMITINELAELMIGISRKNLKINHLSSKKGDIRNSVADISKAKKKLEFNPQVELNNGIVNLLKSS